MCQECGCDCPVKIRWAAAPITTTMTMDHGHSHGHEHHHDHDHPHSILIRTETATRSASGFGGAPGDPGKRTTGWRSASRFFQRAAAGAERPFIAPVSGKDHVHPETIRSLGKRLRPASSSAIWPRTTTLSASANRRASGADHHGHGMPCSKRRWGECLEATGLEASIFSSFEKRRHLVCPLRTIWAKICGGALPARGDLYSESQGRQGWGQVPAGDKYFLGRANFAKVQPVPLTKPEQGQESFRLRRKLLHFAMQFLRTASCR